MSDNSDLFHLKEGWRLRAHTAEEKVEKLEAEVDRLEDLLMIRQCNCDDWMQMECDADRQIERNKEGITCRWFLKASAYQAANRLAAIQLTPFRKLVEKKDNDL